MEVAVDGDAVVVLQQSSDQGLDMIDRGVGLLDSVLVLSVEISSGQVTPGVAYNDAVRVEHRDYLEDEQLPESLSCLSVAGEVVQHSSHHPGGGRLSGVNPGSDDDSCN